MNYKNIEEAIKIISKNKPKLIFLTGRSASGKTTFSKLLKDVGYEILELDEIIGKNVVEHFNIQDSKEAFYKIYKGIASEEWINYFINEVRNHIGKFHHVPLLIEGAISNVDILQKIFHDRYANYTFLYLYPVSLEKYKERIEKRFVQDIAEGTTSLPIWPVPAEILEEYNKNDLNSDIVQEYLNKVSNEIYQGAIDRFHYFKDNGIENIVTVGV